MRHVIFKNEHIDSTLTLIFNVISISLKISGIHKAILFKALLQSEIAQKWFETLEHLTAPK